MLLKNEEAQETHKIRNLNKYWLVGLFWSQIWPWEEQLKVEVHIDTKTVDQCATLEICFKNIDLFFSVKQGVQKFKNV